jgi:DNA (cytosine-5)-methyltransferase 1
MRGTSDRHLDGAAIDINAPIPTITAGGVHVGLCEPFLTTFYGNGGPISLSEPLDTVTRKDRFALILPRVVLNGTEYYLDINLRMLQPDELSDAQSFPKTYRYAGNKTEITKQIGNAVPPVLAMALTRSLLTQ